MVGRQTIQIPTLFRIIKLANERKTEAIIIIMPHTLHLNAESKRRISNIVTNARNHPNYRNHVIRSYVYDLRQGVEAIEITKNGQLINLWLFLPGINGEIDSIACYGMYLEGHYQAIKRSMSVFGMNVLDVTMEEGMSPYVDIQLDSY